MDISSYIKSKKYTDSRVTELTGLDLTSVNDKMVDFQEELTTTARIPVGQIFTATANQTTFTLNNTYEMGKKLVAVEVDNVPQTLGEGFTETTDNSITLSEGVPAGSTVKVTLYKTPIGMDTKISDLTTQLAQIALYGKNYGMKMDGVTDDTIAFRLALADAQLTRKKLIVSGKIRITDEILINNAVWIEAEGNEQGNGAVTSYSNTQFLFDNGEVDVNGNATKSCFRFKKNIDYALHNIKLKNFSIKAIQQPKNQHLIIFENADFAYSNLENLAFHNQTGYAIAISHGYAQNINWKNLSFYNCGGCIGRIDGATDLIVTLAVIENLNLDGTVNSVSPQSCMYNFNGWRWGLFSSVLCEGTLGTIATDVVAFKFNDNNIINNLWIEFSGTKQPKYSLEFSGGAMLQINNMTGVLNTSPINLTHDKAQLIINRLDSYNADINAIVLFTSPLAYCEINGLIVGKSNKRNANLIGKLNLQNVSNVFGTNIVKYDYAKNIELFKHNGGFLEDNGVCTFAKSGNYHVSSIQLKTDANEGRCVVYKYNGTDDLPYWNVKIDVPPEFRGSQLIIGMRGKIVTTDPTSVVGLLYADYTIPNAYNVKNGDNVKNAWSEEYLVCSNVGASVTIQRYAVGAFSALHEFWISDLVIVLGNELPILRKNHFKSTLPIRTKINTIPTLGDFVAGDDFVNTSPTPNAYSGWRCTTGGTDGAAVLKGYGLLQA